MTTLEVQVQVPDTVEELFEMLGDPAEDPTEPMILRLEFADTRSRSPRRSGDMRSIDAPVGLYRMPKPGERLQSLWPAVFNGPLDPRGAHASLWWRGKCVRPKLKSPELPRLWKRDSMTVHVTITGVSGSVS